MFALYYFTPFAYFTHRAEFNACYNLLRYSLSREYEITSMGKTTKPPLEAIAAAAERDV